MALESGTYINSLVATNPAATDSLAAADDHLRLIKSTIKNTFPNISNAVNLTQAEANIIDGDTAATSTTLVGADRFVVNDDGTMVQVALTDLLTYLDTDLTSLTALTTVGASGTATTIGGLTYPSADGTNGQVLSTNGSGAVAFTSLADFTLPAGLIFPYAGITAPSGYVLCYGQAISRTTYATLFTAIGTTYGTGDGSSTFNLPDLRGRVVAGQDDMGGTSADRLTNQTAGVNGDTLGATGGAETHLNTSAQSGLRSHTHSATTQIEIDQTSDGNNTGLRDTPNVNTTFANGFATTTINASGSLDASEAHNNVQPTMVLNYIITTGGV